MSDQYVVISAVGLPLFHRITATLLCASGPAQTSKSPFFLTFFPWTPRLSVSTRGW
ncbi:hypothetical protein HanIR_Chr07g0331171 [Helianthus annuus]|nr:hypothetical protein HanIR_Chr07g0331171 [Helianthus annuus]